MILSEIVCAASFTEERMTKALKNTTVNDMIFFMSVSKQTGVMMSIRAVLKTLIASIVIGFPCIVVAEQPKDYISLDLAYPYYKRIFDKLASTSKTNIETRGEAHITLITPPEFKILSKKIPAATLHQMAENFIKTTPSFEHVCLGIGEKFGAGKTYFIVVKSADFLAFRISLAQKAQLPKNVFDAEKYYPHVTLGFTLRDLHIDDGVIKDARSCPKNLQFAIKEKG